MLSESVVFNGITYRRYPGSKRRSDRVYYRPHSGKILEGFGYLHRDIWKHYNGEIPAGYHIHHADGDPLNNTIENLICTPGVAHISDHSAEFYGDPKNRGLAIRHLDRIREKATEWHRSPEGRAWHRQHAKETYTPSEPEVRICEHCGAQFEDHSRSGAGKYCSNACKSAFRRASDVDNTRATCEYCGEEFTKNKYSKQRFCSASCARSQYWANRKNPGCVQS